MMRQPGLSAESQRWEMRGAVWIAISLLLLVPKKTRRIGCMGLLALVLSLLFNNMLLKHLIARSRPYDCIRGLIPLITPPTDYSFPSGHTAASFAVGVLLFGNCRSAMEYRHSYLLH